MREPPPIHFVGCAPGFQVAQRRGSNRSAVNAAMPRIAARLMRALARDPGVEVSCLLYHPGLSKPGGGTKVISDFPLKVDATTVISGVQNTFGAGAHTVSETTDPTYTAVISGACRSSPAMNARAVLDSWNSAPAS